MGIGDVIVILVCAYAGYKISNYIAGPYVFKSLCQSCLDDKMSGRCTNY